MELLWKNEIGKGGSQHYVLKRQTPTLRPFLPLHTHDYAELVYLERGSCFHEVNGVVKRANKGDILFLQPHISKHCYRNADENLYLLQVLFHKDTYSLIANRYDEVVTQLFTDTQRNPLCRLDTVQQIWFERNYNRLLITDRSLIEIERFLLNVIGLIGQSNQKRGGDPVAQWMDHAFREIQEPENFSRGVSGFVELCYRSAAHVEREVKRRTGHTVTDVVNQARMSWASYMLVYSDVEILDIVLGCGFESLSYFYKLFKKYFNMSPAKYRKVMVKSSSLQELDILRPYRFDYIL